MISANSTLTRAQRWTSSYLWRSNMPLDRPGGVISFSFDDAMHSACAVGRQILERQNCYGTWYIAGGLTDGQIRGRRYHSVSDIQELARGGHHIGCHTYSHRACDQMTHAEMSLDTQRNAAFFAQSGLPNATQDFAFPFGAIDITSKRLAAKTFRSSRLSGGGIQVDQADLNALRTEKLYQHLFTFDRILSLTKEVAQKGAWLIFNTHEVTEDPGQWGCTPALLDYGVQSALQTGCKVLPINLAIEYFQSNV